MWEDSSVTRRSNSNRELFLPSFVSFIWTMDRSLSRIAKNSHVDSPSFTHTLLALVFKCTCGEERKPPRPNVSSFPHQGSSAGRALCLLLNGWVGKSCQDRKETKRESFESRHKREEKEYDDLYETQLIVICGGFVTFCRHLKYLGNWISFSLQDDHSVAKRIAAANASMGAMSKIWEDDHVDLYYK